jgi:serine/threonine-protein kinase RsbW
MTSVEQRITLDIPARPEYVVLCRLALAGLLRDRGFSDDAVDDLKLAITEACTNSIRHAYPAEDGGVGQVHISYEVLADRVVLVVQDQGGGFHNDDQPSRFEDGTLWPSEGGMGMSIIQAVVDDFRLEQPAAGGTRVVLTKLCDS